MILYCIICYLIMLSIVLTAKETSNDYKYPWIMVILSPFTLPLLIGMIIEEERNKK